MTEEGEIKIEKNVPVPDTRQGYEAKTWPYPWKDMAAGDSFELETGRYELCTLRRHIISSARSYGIKIKTRSKRSEDRDIAWIRVWCVSVPLPEEIEQ